ncbi:ABC transporter permease [Streptococcus porcorum]|uniref:ABC-2 type transport system permease protein n=1 Tax=Streptococcus porcorum TaxID=701526 RepID=A0ABV2JCN4_9STRE
MKQLLLVAKETYLRQVKSWTFFFMVVSPFIFIFISAGVGYLTDQSTDNQDKVALISSSNEVTKAFKSVEDITLSYSSIEKARSAFDQEKIAAYLEVEINNGIIEAIYHGKTSLSGEMKVRVDQILQGLQQASNVQQAGLSQEQLTTLTQQPVYKEQLVKGQELAEAGKYIAFFGLVFMLYMMILTYAGLTAQEIASEKGTKIMEVIFSSVPAPLYFYGRILGIFLVITTHLGIYLLGGVATYKVLDYTEGTKEMVQSIEPLIKAVFENLDWSMMFFVGFGLLLYVVLAALSGSLVVRQEDVNKAIQPIMYIVIACFFGAMTLGQGSSDSVFLQVGSYLPFTSTFFMPIRLMNGFATTVESIISLIVLTLTTLGLIILIGKSYAGLILQTDDVGLWKSLKKGLSSQ